MKYKNIVSGIFLARPNRFIAQCLINGEEVTVHVKNTGRCKELLVKGATVFLEKATSVGRKTPYSIVAVLKGQRLINMDSQAPNVVVKEGLLSGKIDLGLGSLKLIKQEVTHGSSRLDFYCETDNDKIFIEVKGVTLEVDNLALFPDAPTERGVKHIKELEELEGQGFKSFIIFVIQMSNPKAFTPNDKTHKAFADELKIAKSKGVGILAYDCIVSTDFMDIGTVVPVKLI